MMLLHALGCSQGRASSGPGRALLCLFPVYPGCAVPWVLCTLSVLYPGFTVGVPLVCRRSLEWRAPLTVPSPKACPAW